jgi:branched-chain amino acid transport system permease protein
MPTLLRPSVAVPLLLFALLAALPFAAAAADQPFWTSFFARILVYAIAASALNLALGYGGLVSFGHALFLGVGAYAVALPAFHGIGSGWVHLFACVAAGALAALAVGVISLRTSGMAFIMITLAFAQMGYFLVVSLKAYGGDDGMAVAATSRFGGLDLGSTPALYAVAWVVLALVTWWMARVRAAPFGMALRGARQNARRIDAIGLQSRRLQLAAFVISGSLCAVAGALLANLNAFVSPSSMAWTVSGELIVMVVLGGIGTVFGPLIVLVSLFGRRGIVGWLDALEKRPAANSPQPAVPVLERRA